MLRVTISFTVRADGSYELPGYEVRDARGELAALGGWGVGGPTFDQVSDLAADTFAHAMRDTIRNGVQLGLFESF